MAIPLRILNIEDSEDDSLLLTLELRQGGYDPVLERVETADTMQTMLALHPWDVVIADYALPRFSGGEALHVLQESGLDLPFIVLSGTIGEERAAEMMRAGAHDVILKGHIARLLPAIARELREAEIRQERQRTQQELLVVNRGLRLLSQVNENLLHATTEEALLQRTCEIAVEVGGYRMAWVGYAEYDEQKTIRPVAHAGVDGDYLAQLRLSWADTSLGYGPTGTATRTGQPSYIHDIATDQSFAPWREEALKRGYRSSIALPLTVDAMIIGALNLYGDTPHAFPAEEVQLLSELANDLAYGIMTLRTRQALHEREAQYRTIVETAQEGIWVIDRDFHTTYVNLRMADMLGYNVAEILGRPMFDFVDRALRTDLERHFEAPRWGRKDVYEFRFRRKDGSELWTITSAAPIMDSHEEYTGAFAMLTDITERHHYEAYQREFARKTIEAATEGKLLIREQDEIQRMAGPSLMTETITSVDDLESVRHAVAEVARNAGMDEERIFDFILCISEATTNAVKHVGCGTISIHGLNDMLLAVISDRGPGIPAINLPEVALKRGYTTGISLGMGYKAMISLADTIYLSTSPEGTTVAIAMALHTPTQPSVSVPELPDVW